MNGGSEMDMNDVLYGFVNAPNASNPFSKPWLSFDNKNVIATNGRVLISIPKKLAPGYRKWDNNYRAEPIIDSIFWGKEDPASYVQVKSDLYDLIKSKAGDGGTIEYRLTDTVYKFDVAQALPIYNFSVYAKARFGDDLFYNARGVVNPVLFRTLSDVRLAIMPIRIRR